MFFFSGKSILWKREKRGEKISNMASKEIKEMHARFAVETVLLYI
jgi:hypothetical protein